MWCRRGCPTRPEPNRRRIFPVRPANEAVQHSFIAGCIHLEHGSETASASPIGGAVKISAGVPEQPSVGIFPIRPPGKRIEHGVGPRFLCGPPKRDCQRSENGHCSDPGQRSGFHASSLNPEFPLWFPCYRYHTSGRLLTRIFVLAPNNSALYTPRRDSSQLLFLYLGPGCGTGSPSASTRVLTL
jgi:hypothetical protein